MTARPRPPPSRPARETLHDVDGTGGPHRHPLAEGPAVAAVEEQDDAARPRAAHAALDEVRCHRGGSETIGPGVPRGDEQLAGVALEAVPGEVQEQQVARAGCRRRGRRRVPGPRRTCALWTDRHLEAADLGVAEHLSQGASVRLRRPQLAQAGVVVGVVGDDERPPRLWHRPRCSARAPRSPAASVTVTPRPLGLVPREEEVDEPSCSSWAAPVSSSTSPAISSRTVRGSTCPRPSHSRTDASKADIPPEPRRATDSVLTVAASRPRAPSGTAAV